MSHLSLPPAPVTARAGAALKGRLRVPGDKSISHRALIFGLLAIGETRIEGLLEGDDVLRTAAACRALGAAVTREAPGRWRVRGAGIGGLTEPAERARFRQCRHRLAPDDGRRGQPPDHLDLRRRRLACGSGRCGASSTRSRRMGVSVLSEAEGGRVPLTLRGPRETVPITYETPAASAQIKSAVLLAGLNSPGTHDRARAGGHPRPHRADAPPFRRAGRGRAARRPRPGRAAAGPAGTARQRRSSCRPTPPPPPSRSSPP